MTKVLFDLKDQGGSIVPIVDGKKSIPGWNKYQTQAPTKDEVTEWISSGDYEGYGLMMGYGKFHVLDIDQKNMPESSSINLSISYAISGRHWN